MTPTPVTAPEDDLGVRALSVYDLEKTLCAFIRRIVESARLDNPTLNLAQPDVVPFDYTERAQALVLKAAPRVERGRVPRTVTGEIAVDSLPDSPNVIVQVVAAKVETDVTVATVRILVHTYDENPDSGGYQDALNITEAIATALTSFGQQAIDKAYPIVMPIEWKLVEADTFPHFIAEMTTTWQLPSGRPMPDSETFGIVPAEHPSFTMEYQYPPGLEPPVRFVPPQPIEPPPAPAQPQLIFSHPVESQDDIGNSYGVQGAANESDPFAMTAAYQVLQLPVGGKLTSIRLWLNARGAPTCDVLVNLYAAAGAAGVMAPTGPILATSGPINAASLTAAGLQEFFFADENQYPLVAGQFYAFVFTYAGAFPVQGQQINLGIYWAESPPNNGGFHQNGWQADDWATVTLYLYAI